MDIDCTKKRNFKHSFTALNEKSTIKVIHKFEYRFVKAKKN